MLAASIVFDGAMSATTVRPATVLLTLLIAAVSPATGCEHSIELS
eukprot:SAG31_NODE_36468_length_313_cov_0.696262_1_plen_44_part_10